MLFVDLVELLGKDVVEDDAGVGEVVEKKAACYREFYQISKIDIIDKDKVLDIKIIIKVYFFGLFELPQVVKTHQSMLLGAVLKNKSFLYYILAL